MKNKEMIIFLIRQDMVHNRLVLEMEHKGMQIPVDYNLEIMEKVADLMGVEHVDLKEDWQSMYLAFQCMVYASMEDDDWKQKLNDLSEKCYNQLLALILGMPLCTSHSIERMI